MHDLAGMHWVHAKQMSVIQEAEGRCSRPIVSQSLRGKPDCFSFGCLPPGTQHSAVSSNCPCLPRKHEDRCLSRAAGYVIASRSMATCFLGKETANKQKGMMPVDMVAFMGPMTDLGMELRCSIWYAVDSYS